jgi:hypothetical protein
VFSFSLPKGAALVVSAPTGGEQVFIHKGDGQFVSDLPPLVLLGISKDAVDNVDGLPVAWDADSFPFGAATHQCTFMFDAVAASRAVEIAAAQRDPAAVAMIERMADADKVLKDRESIGMVKAPEVVQ